MYFGKCIDVICPEHDKEVGTSTVTTSQADRLTVAERPETTEAAGPITKTKVRKPKRSSIHAGRARFGLLMVAPMMIGFALFCLVPICIVFWLSLTNWSMFGTPEFVGVANYAKAFSTPLFWQSLLVTTLYAAISLPVSWVLSMGLALLLEKALPGTKLFRVIYLVPWVTTPIAIASVFRWIFDPISGVANVFLGFLGIPAVPWFSNQMALVTVALINIWQFSGYITLLFLVGLQAIPVAYSEAAAIDGAGYWRVFWHIKLPQMRPTLIFVSVTGVIGSFQVFDTIFGITKGGPGDSTRVFYYYIYQQAFSYTNVGYASALCVVLFAILLAFTGIQFRFFAGAPDDYS